MTPQNITGIAGVSVSEVCSLRRSRRDWLLAKTDRHRWFIYTIIILYSLVYLQCRFLPASLLEWWLTWSWRWYCRLQESHPYFSRLKTLSRKDFTSISIYNLSGFLSEFVWFRPCRRKNTNWITFYRSYMSTSENVSCVGLSFLSYFIFHISQLKMFT